MSSSSKRRKVTVDIKQTKLERGSVFARLGSKEKHRKKTKGDPDVVVKSKKEIVKQDFDNDEVKKKSKSSRSDEVTPTKKSKEYSSSTKIKTHEYEAKEHRKSHRRSEERQAADNEGSHVHSKRKSDRSERKIENLIIEKRMSPMLVVSEDLSRSASPRSLSPKKKSKKHSTKNLSHDSAKRLDRSPSPDRFEPRKHKERGRSREKKKSTKDSSKKSKESNDLIDVESQDISRHLSKSKKSSKHKPDKYYSDDVVIEKKGSKLKSSRERPKEYEKDQGKISPVVYDPSSDDQYNPKHESTAERPSKSKRRKNDQESQSVSPARHKKSKRHLDVDDASLREVHQPRNHSVKKRTPKDSAVPKKKVQKEDSSQGYSDFSPVSKQSQAGYSEMSQTSAANDDQYSSDAYIEKESKRRSKSKKKTKKDNYDSSSKPHYEVIDDDYSDEGKKEKKKRKRKRDEEDYVKSPQDLQGYEDQSRDNRATRKKSEQIRPPEKLRHSDKYLPPRDDIKLFERKISPQSSSSRHEPRTDRTVTEVKRDHREHEKYRESHKGYNRDVRDKTKGDYVEMKHPRDKRYSPERRDTGFVHTKLPARHFSSERSNQKVMDWHHDNVKHGSCDRKESIPRLMAMPHDQDHHADSSRSSINKYPQRKRSDQDYLDQYRGDHTRSAPASSERNVMRPTDRRPPPLLPPNFNRSRTPSHVSHSRETHGFLDNDRFGDTHRKYEKINLRDSLPHADGRDRKRLGVHDDHYNDRPARSGSQDSRSSHQRLPLLMKSKTRNPVDVRSPRTDRNSSHERKDTRKVLGDGPNYVNKGKQNENRHSRSREGSLKLIVNNGNERGRISERAGSLKRQRDESSGSRRSSPLQDRSKKRRINLREGSQHKANESTKSPAKDYERNRKPVKKTTLKKTDDRGKSATKKQVEPENLVPEVDWNQLPSSAKSQATPKEKSHVLSRFTPGSILQRTGIIMSILPDHLISRIIKTEPINQKENAGSQLLSVTSKILENGLNSYSDEKLRKQLLGYNIQNEHGYYPPSVINGRTYAASMKTYLRKARLVEPI